MPSLPHQSCFRALLLVSSLAAFSCTAETKSQNPGAAGNSNAGSGNAAAGSSGGPGDVGGPPQVPGPPVAESAGVMPLLRLTHREYSSTMADLLSEASEAGAAFEADIPGRGGYDAPSMVAT